jgi:thiamine biosynthesis lipoprotein
MAGAPRADVAAALAAAPARAAASARGDERWRAVRIDNAAGTITRPPGLRLDTGGTTKGLAADAVGRLLDGARRLVVDCAGDLRMAGAPAFDVVVEHPLRGEPAATLSVGAGAVATSGLGRRVWRGPGGGVAHHLLDPATGEPAWTGLVSATATAPTALEAETLAKTALLRGPAGARRVLSRRGGVLIHDDGTVERVGAAARPRVRLRRDELRPGAAVLGAAA